MPDRTRFPRVGLRTAAALGVSLGLAGCLPPPNNAGQAPGASYQQPQAVADPNPEGYWCFRDSQGREQTNLITVQSDGRGLDATGDAGNGQAFFYEKISPNTWVDQGPGNVYQFIDDNHGIWRSHDRRTMFELFRCD